MKWKSKIKKSLLTLSLTSPLLISPFFSLSKSVEIEQIDLNNVYSQVINYIEPNFKKLITYLNDQVEQEIKNSPFPDENLYGKKRFYNNLNKHFDKHMIIVKTSIKNVLNIVNQEVVSDPETGITLYNTLSLKNKIDLVSEYLRILNNLLIGTNSQLPEWASDKNNFSKYKSDYNFSNLDNDMTPSEELKINNFLSNLMNNVQKKMIILQWQELENQRKRDRILLNKEIASNNIVFDLRPSAKEASAFELRERDVEIEYANHDLDIVDLKYEFLNQKELLKSNGKIATLKITFALNNAQASIVKNFTFARTLFESRQFKWENQEKDIQNHNVIRIDSENLKKDIKQIKLDSFSFEKMEKNFEIKLTGLREVEQQIVLDYSLILEPFTFEIAKNMEQFVSEQNEKISNESHYLISKEKPISSISQKIKVDVLAKPEALKLSSWEIDNNNLEQYFYFKNQDPNFEYVLTNFRPRNKKNGILKYYIFNKETNEKKNLEKEFNNFLSTEEEIILKSVNDQSAQDINLEMKDLLEKKYLNDSGTSDLTAFTTLFGGYFLEDNLENVIFNLNQNLESNDPEYSKANLTTKIEKLRNEFEKTVMDKMKNNNKEFADVVNKKIQNKILEAENYLKTKKNLDPKVLKEQFEKIQKLKNELNLNILNNKNLEFSEILKKINFLNIELEQIQNIDLINKLLEQSAESNIDLRKFKKTIDLVILWIIFSVSISISIISSIAAGILLFRKKKKLKSKSSLLFINIALALTTIIIAIYSFIEALF